jgi:hypothetical protein
MNIGLVYDVHNGLERHEFYSMMTLEVIISSWSIKKIFIMAYDDSQSQKTYKDLET